MHPLARSAPTGTAPVHGGALRAAQGFGNSLPLATWFVLSSCAWGCTWAWSQEAPAADNPEIAKPPSRLTYSLGMKLDIGDLRHFDGLKLRPTMGLRYGRWRIGAVDQQSWPRFGQALQDKTLTYDWLKDTHWHTSLSANVINLDQDTTFDAFRSGRKTLRAKAALDYNLDRHWSLGLSMGHDLLKRGDGTSLSPTLTYLHPLDNDSAWLLSTYTTWATATHWQSEAARHAGSGLRQDAGLGSWGAQVTYRQRGSAHWAFFTQLSTSRLIEPTQPAAHPLGWSGQLGVIYFSH